MLSHVRLQSSIFTLSYEEGLDADFEDSCGALSLCVTACRASIRLDSVSNRLGGCRCRPRCCPSGHLTPLFVACDHVWLASSVREVRVSKHSDAGAMYVCTGVVRSPQSVAMQALMLSYLKRQAVWTGCADCTVPCIH